MTSFLRQFVVVALIATGAAYADETPSTPRRIADVPMSKRTDIDAALAEYAKPVLMEAKTVKRNYKVREYGGVTKHASARKIVKR